MAKKILFMRLSSLGDIILSEPVVRIAREAFPGYEIHYLTKPIYSELVTSFGVVDRVIATQSIFRTLSILKSERYEYIIDLHGKLYTWLIRLFVPVGKSKVVYPKMRLLRQLIVWKVSSGKIASVVWQYLQTIKKTNRSTVDFHQIMEQKTYYPILTPTKDDIEKVSEIFDDYNIPRNKYLICIFPGSRHFTKCYPIEKFANAILNIPDHFNCAILIMGDWTEKPLAIELKSYTGMKLYDLTGALSIAQTIAAVSLAHIVITNDSGPMHIAAALRKKQIAIYGATHTNLGFRPLNDDAIILESEVKCRPCSLHGGKSCKKGSLACLKNIHSDDVYDAFAYLFDEIITTETPIK